MNFEFGELNIVSYLEISDLEFLEYVISCEAGSYFLILQLPIRPDGGIGRRAGLKNQFPLEVPVRPRLRVPRISKTPVGIMLSGVLVLWLTDGLTKFVLFKGISFRFTQTLGGFGGLPAEGGGYLNGMLYFYSQEGLCIYQLCVTLTLSLLIS